MDCMNYEDLGRRIRDARKRQKLTMANLAKRTGMSLSFLGHIERGSRKASLETLVRICIALDVTPMYLLAESLTTVARGDVLKMRDALHGIIAQAEQALGLAE